MTFRQRYLLGIADFDEIFDLTDQWNFSDETCTLREFLGLTADEEDIWISDSDEALEDFMNQEKNRRILFTDIDGTLVNDERKITEKTRKELSKFLSDKNCIVLSTGRARKSTLEEAQILGLNQANCYAICYNGARIYDLTTGECIYQDSIPLDLVQLCFDEAKKYGIHIQTYTENEVIAEKDDEELQVYSKKLKIEPYIVPSVVEELKRLSIMPPKMLAIDSYDIEKLKAFRVHLHNLVGDKLNLFFSHPTYMEIVSPTVNKGAAVTYLCEYLAIQMKNCVAAGDAENDISMLQAAGVGVAMINGTDQVKKAADYITKADNNHDGVLEALSLFPQN